MSKNNIETRKDEVRKTTSEPKEMLGKYLAERLLRSWKEEFIDEDTGEVVNIERHEVILDKGTRLDGHNLAEIDFFLQSGDVKEVIVSNQKRLAYSLKNEALYPYIAVIRIGKKNKKFILHSASVEMAIEIVKDYVELNFTEGFILTNIKEFERCIILKDTLKKYEDDTTIDLGNIDLEEYANEDFDLKFYQISVTIKNDESEYLQSFLIETTDADKAMIVIKDFIIKSYLDSNQCVSDIEIKLETAKIVPCDSIIEKEFSMAYAETSDTELKVYSSQDNSQTNATTELDSLLKDAALAIIENKNASVSFIQRKFSLGYNRAGKIIDQLEKIGVISVFQGSKSREILMDVQQLECVI